MEFPDFENMEQADNVIVIEDSDDSKDGEIQIVNSTENENTTEGNEKDAIDCPICLQSCIHPIKLPCGHIFCYLCVKGVAYKNHRCAMCRREIPLDFLDNPHLVHGVQDLYRTKETEDGYQWFYQGRNGWWQYDERTSQDIEEAYKKGEKTCNISVAGYLYVVDFQAMLQQRQDDPSRRRHVKRDLATIPKKGVAGLRIVDSSSSVSQSSTTVTMATATTSSSTAPAIATSSTVDDNVASVASSLSSMSLNHSTVLGLYLVNNESDEPSSTSSSSSLQQRDENYLQSSLISSTSNFISPIAATDAAIRIASDIIDSTLAHANEINRTEEEDSDDNVDLLLDNDNFSNLNSSTTERILIRSNSTELLDDFRSLTQRNVIDSSDSEDEDRDQIIL